jgi:eukaryotic-like serine/threonine-protein kinase
MRPDVIGGRYTVRTAIGQGGMGTVWLCRDEKLARDVAVKQVGLLPGESVTDAARAFREARTSAALSHHNVVSVFDVVEESDRIWLVMEYLPSRTLAEMIRDEGRLDPDQVASIGAQVADGLVAAHAAGMIHRDVKPGNILVTADGVAKISDFGIARTEGDPALTSSDLVTGTPTYFSPELATGADPSPAADVWALGATLYAAVEGTPPYPPQANPVAMLSTIVQEQPPRPRHAGELATPLSRMLDRNPSTRWTMTDVAHSLHRVARRAADQGRTAAATAAFAREPAPSPEPPEPPPREPLAQRTSHPRRRPVGRYLLAAVALLVALAGVALVASLRDDPGGAPAASGRDGETSPESSPESSSESSPATSAPDEGGEPAPDGQGGPRVRQVAFLEDYFSTAPTDQDAGWARLGPQGREVGRASYDDFWGSIRSVDTSGFEPGPTPDTMDVTLRYEYDDGRVVVERQRLTLVGDGDGGYLIDDDQVLSSRTVAG